MKTNLFYLLSLSVIFSLGIINISAQNIELPGNFYEFSVKDIHGNDYDLSQLKGKKTIVVNVASACGLTPQYECLQNLYENIDTSKFALIAFPANNFLRQESGTEEEILEFCKTNFGVSFPIMSKVSVAEHIYLSFPADKEKSEPTEISDIYRWLTVKDYNGYADTDVFWNFHKFLIDENGNLKASIHPSLCDEIRLLIDWLE